MATATISGTISYPLVAGIPATTIYLGNPTITSSSSGGATITFNEGGTQGIIVGSSAPVSIPMGTVASGSLLYVGTNQPVEMILNGGSDTIDIAADGFVLMSKCGIVSATLQAVSASATVTVAVLGD